MELTTAFTLVSVQRILAIATGAFLCYLGYRLFMNVPTKEDSEGKITLPSGIGIQLTRVGPGVFFSLFGTIIMIIFFQHPMEYRELISETKAVADSIARRTDTVKPPTADTAHPSQPALSQAPVPQAAVVNSISKETRIAGATPGGKSQDTQGRTVSRSDVNQDIRSMNQLAALISRDPSLDPIKRSTHLTMIDNVKCSMMLHVWDTDWGSYDDFRDRINGNKKKPLNQSAFAYFNSGKENP